MFLTSVLASLLLLLPSRSIPTSEVVASTREDGSTRIIATIPVREIQASHVTADLVWIQSAKEAIFVSPSMVWLSGDQSVVIVGVRSGGDGWVNLPNALPGPGTYEMEWFDKFGRKVRVVVPCNGLTEERCAEIFRNRVTMAEKMYPPVTM
jgi:hypothetical protein